MTRYYFHILDDGETVLDEEGDEFQTLEDAGSNAVKAVRELAAARLRSGLTISDSRLDVCDAMGELQLSLSFHDVIDAQMGR